MIHFFHQKFIFQFLILKKKIMQLLQNYYTFQNIQIEYLISRYNLFNLNLKISFLFSIYLININENFLILIIFRVCKIIYQIK
jgi:hypothetical protein